MQNMQNKHTNTRTSKQNCIRTMQLSGIKKTRRMSYNSVILDHSLVFRVTYTRGCIDTIDSPDDGEHEVARNMYRIEINIKEKRIVYQVGHLPELDSVLVTRHKVYYPPGFPAISYHQCQH
jgi:hypothetical protein